MAKTTGAIMRQAHVANADPNVFYEQMVGHIRSSEGYGYYTEVQYQVTMQPDGKALHCALILSRKKEDVL